jgi:hypothetical protein
MRVHNYFRGSRKVNTFEINHLTYEIRFSEHADLRLVERSIDELQVASAILSLGSKN